MVFLIDTKLGFLPTPHLAGKYAVVLSKFLSSSK
jgi:hypothetical protein